MAELTANGADTAELYFQHQRTNVLAMEDGIVSRANSGISQGVGLRVVIGDQTGYAFTEDLTLPSMLHVTVLPLTSTFRACHFRCSMEPAGEGPRSVTAPFFTTMSECFVFPKAPMLQRV